jgi:hypothetical protein
MSPNPPSPSASRNLARQRLALKIVIGFLVLSALLIATLATRLALPIRLFVAATDLIVSAVLWLLLRQKFRGE